MRRQRAGFLSAATARPVSRLGAGACTHLGCLTGRRSTAAVLPTRLTGPTTSGATEVGQADFGWGEGLRKPRPGHFKRM